MRETLGLDLDGVLYDWRRAVWPMFVAEYGEVRSFHDFWFEEERAERNGESVYNELFWRNLVLREDLYEACPPKKGVVETLWKLKQKYNLVYITHRPLQVKFITEWWLKSYDFPERDMLIISSLPKHLLTRQYGCDYYVEDREKILNSQLKNVCTLFGVRSVSNYTLEGDPRITFIDEIPELLNYLGG
jgi:uncharacterized HAD superfamily protein